MVLEFASPRFAGDPLLVAILNDPDTGTMKLQAGSPPDSDFAPAADWRIDLDRAMACLSDAQRHALLLCYGSDLSHAEAALVLGWPLGTLKTQVLRAKARLRARLGEENP